jgi:hypothetical protein
MPQLFRGHGCRVGQSGGCSCSRRGCGHGQVSPQVPIPYVRGAQLVPYAQGVAQQGQRHPIKCIQTKLNGMQTRTCATRAASMSRLAHEHDMPMQEAGAPGWLYLRKLHSVRPSRLPFLQDCNAQESVPIYLMVGGGESRY